MNSNTTINLNNNNNNLNMNNLNSINNKNLGSINLYELLSSQLIHNHLPEFLIDSFDTNKSSSKILKKNKNSRSLISINNISMINDSDFQKCIRIFIGTWNMMGRSPPPNIKPFIDINNDNYHIVAIGTQECGKNITEAMIFPSCEEWEKALQKHLTKKYQMIKSEVMGSIHLAIFINKECSSHVKNVKAYNVKTGVANVMTNKGAIGISLQFDALTFLFVNSHLTAYQKKVSDRNDDYKRISKGLHMNLNNNNYDQSYDYIFWFGDLNYRINGIRSIVDKLIKENQLEVLLANDQLKIEMNKGNAFNSFSEAPITFRPTYKFDVYTKNYVTNDMSIHSPVPTISSEGRSLSNNYINPSLLLNNNSNVNNSINHQKLNIDNKPNINNITGAMTLATTRIPSWTDRILFRVRHQKPPTSPNTYYLPYQNQNSILQQQQQEKEKEKEEKEENTINDDDNSSITKQSIYNNMNSIRIPLKPIYVEKYTSCENMYWSDHKPVIGSFRINNDWSSDDITNNKKVIHRKTNKPACIIQ
ncbi:DNase I-like protein [Anaeromyces robustus]|uniref:DNase I-like protein n=1 Tax=Anaeromyces robustus TaxID=1754192 RepID=A0A1Y1WX03_9FUNG|nr:DNase I-like protein [Anaeromyces robustus]|eukprot:ORX77736.1 DNase I-like protein [Anaeromyces robustus]